MMEEDMIFEEVALRKESVDRNLSALPGKAVTTVALRKESVDRNVNNAEIDKHNRLSLSARRAWIEISKRMYHITYKESRSPQGERG